MTRTVSVSADIPTSREVRIVVPDDFPSGPAEITVVHASGDVNSTSTLGELAASEFFGMWRDREDIPDSTAFARELRESGWKRQV